MPSYHISPPNTKLPNHGLAHETKREILKNCKNEFNWLEIIFFIKEEIFYHFGKVSSDCHQVFKLSKRGFLWPIINF